MSDVKEAPKAKEPAAPESPKVAAAPPKEPPAAKETMFWAGPAYKQQDWEHWADRGVTPEHLLDRNYWRHVSSKMLPMAKIKAMDDQRNWYAEYVVFAVFGQGADVRMIGDPVRYHGLGASGEGAAEFSVYYEGLQKNWCVKRLKDDRIIMAQLRSQTEADAWLRDYMRTIREGNRAA